MEEPQPQPQPQPAAAQPHAAAAAATAAAPAPAAVERPHFQQGFPIPKSIMGMPPPHLPECRGTEEERPPAVPIFSR